MYYTVYKITNRINNKYYIGKHATNNLDDGYMGSGKLIRKAIKKYGIENFTKEFLHIFNTELEMNEAEANLVVINENSYNLCPGGHGGFGYIHDNGLHLKGLQNRDHKSIAKKAAATRLLNPKPISETTKQLISENNKRTNVSRGLKNSEKLKNKTKTDDHKQNIRNSLLGKTLSEETKAKIAVSARNRNLGRTLSEETKAKIAAARLGKKFPRAT